MSLEGDFEEFDEFFNALASCSSSLAIRSDCTSTILRNSAMMSSLVAIRREYQLLQTGELPIVTVNGYNKSNPPRVRCRLRRDLGGQ